MKRSNPCSGRSLEEIDTMFLMEVKPWKSASWVPPKGEELLTVDHLRLNSGATQINKKRIAGQGEAEQQESATRPGEEELPYVPIMSGRDNFLGRGVRGQSYG